MINFLFTPKLSYWAYMTVTTALFMFQSGINLVCVILFTILFTVAGCAVEIFIRTAMIDRRFRKNAEK
jgi:hypothetical protein